MHVDAKSSRCWKYSPGDPKSLLPPGPTFQPNSEAVSTGLTFVIIICTQPQQTHPILIENNKNHQIMLLKGRIGFPSLDVADKEELKYQIRNPFEITNAIITTDEKYNDCFLLRSTRPLPSPDNCLQIFHGSENSIVQQPHSIIKHCISADAKMSKGFADLLSQRISGLQNACRRKNLLTGQTYLFWDQTDNRYIYNLATKTFFFETPNLPTLPLTLEAMNSHARMYRTSTITIPKIGCGLDHMNWQ